MRFNMLAKALKKFGNSKCLPLDKTLLNILGIEFDNESVIISVEENRLILQKAPVFEEQTKFVLSDAQWDAFNENLETKQNLSNLSKLLSEKSVLDE